MSNLFRWIFFAVLTAVAGCGDGGGEIGPPTADHTPPRVTSAEAVDRFHVRVAFDEDLDKPYAERLKNVTVIEGTAAHSGAVSPSSPAPGDTLDLLASVLEGSRRELLITLADSLKSTAYELTVTGVRDLSGNEMHDTQRVDLIGSTAPDVTPPTTASIYPSDTQEGVGIGESIFVQFSEPMNSTLLYVAFNLRTRGETEVDVSMTSIGPTTYRFKPVLPLAPGVAYVIEIAGAAEDLSGNRIAPRSWFFATSFATDTIPPQVESTTPPDGAVDVQQDATLEVVFTEPIDPATIGDEGLAIAVSPDPGGGVVRVDTERRSLAFDPDQDLEPLTQYAFAIPSGSIKDPAGNVLSGAVVVTFTTGPSLATGQVSGTVVGDDRSTKAVDPRGTLVVASTSSPFDLTGEARLRGIDIAGDDGSYSITRLSDGFYFLFGVLDTNDDGIIDPARGDAFGAHGVDILRGDLEADTVRVDGGGHVASVGVALYDPVSISGVVIYDDSLYSGRLSGFEYFVGAFDTTTFDTTGGFPEPDYGTVGVPITEHPAFVLGELSEAGLSPGTYWIGAFLDVNTNGRHDPGHDPTGFYSGPGGRWLPVTVFAGADLGSIVLRLIDPPSEVPGASRWRGPPSKGVRTAPRFNGSLPSLSNRSEGR